eukprot:8496878-Pyramimonas_sp.AAC.1
MTLDVSRGTKVDVRGTNVDVKGTDVDVRGTDVDVRGSKYSLTCSFFTPGTSARTCGSDEVDAVTNKGKTHHIGSGNERGASGDSDDAAQLPSQTNLRLLFARAVH